MITCLLGHKHTVNRPPFLLTFSKKKKTITLERVIAKAGVVISLQHSVIKNIFHTTLFSIYIYIYHVYYVIWEDVD